MSEKLAATVILPTTKNRWMLLQYSLDCILRQSVTDLEVFIIGDGVEQETKDWLSTQIAKDSRIRFFDHPKHESRGEPYRHEALKEAHGSAILYCCDRDLWLPHHAETILDGLKDADFIQVIPFEVMRDGSIHSFRFVDLTNPAHRAVSARRWSKEYAMTLSAVGHTLESYHELEEGWNTTPEGFYTDQHMWHKFLSDRRVIAATIRRSTFLYFERGKHPGMPVKQRAEELDRWHERMGEPDFHAECLEQLEECLYNQRLEYRDEMTRFRRNPICSLGYHLGGFLMRFPPLRKFRPIRRLYESYRVIP